MLREDSFWNLRWSMAEVLLQLVILQRGTIHRGDHFTCGSAFGKVSSIKNFAGKTLLSEVGPSDTSAIIAGFSELTTAGRCI
jgi:translation initiation factor IF-2